MHGRVAARSGLALWGMVLGMGPGPAWATGGATVDRGFAVDDRYDVPSDAMVLIDANFPQVRVVVGPGAPYELESQGLVGFGTTYYSALLPPAGGWVPGERYELSSEPAPYANRTPEADDLLVFEAVAEAAGPPPEVVQVEVEPSEWLENTDYGWGCCEDVRTLELTVTLPDGADPWAWVEARGLYELGRPSQITTGMNDRHDVGIGPGVHVLRVVQWVDEGFNQPPCVELVPRSAAGEEGEAVEVCLRDNLEQRTWLFADVTRGGGTGGVPYEAGGCGCTAGRSGGAWFGLLAALALARRRWAR